MKRIVTILLFFVAGKAFSQQALPATITAEKARAHLGLLAADSLQGRGNGTWKLYTAARYIASHFAAAGLKPLPGEHSFYLPFSLFNKNKLPPPVILRWNEKNIDATEFQWIGKDPIPQNTLLLHDFTIIHHDSAFSETTLLHNWPGTGNLVLWTTIPQADGKRHFPKKILARDGGQQRNVLLVYCAGAPVSLQAEPNNAFIENAGLNIAGYLPGKNSKEKLLVGAHYDHEGGNGPKRDPVMNGANDNASGTTAMLLLADYFGQSPQLPRSLVFMAFAGEEMGLLGSTHQSKRMNSKEIIAMVNLEMLAIPQYGEKTVFITGDEYSALPALLTASLVKHHIRTVPEPAGQGLFFRSDNLGFAERGIPAHTIMASDDTDECYHKPCDDTERVDFDNLAALTHGIATAIEDILNSTEKPRRIRQKIDYRGE